jgi:hypothetical protein
MTMTSFDRLDAALSGQAVDRLPFSPFLAYWWEHSPASVQAAGQRAFLASVGADPLWRGAPCPVREVPPAELRVQRTEVADLAVTTVSTPVGQLVCEHRRSAQGNTWFLTKHPLLTGADFRTQLWIEEHTTVVYDDGEARRHLAGDGQDGLSVGMLTPWGKSAFQRLVEHFVGTEELAYAMADHPDEVETLLAAMQRNHLAAVRLSAERGPYAWWLTWEDSSTQNYSPAQYRRFIAPEIATWCSTLAGHGSRYMQHACGHVHALLPMMRDSGIAAIESVSPRPTGNIAIADVRSVFGSRLGIVGGIEPIEFLSMADDRFDAYVEETIAAASGGPFVLANSDSCPPGVPIARFRRVVEIARAFRP